MKKREAHFTRLGPKNVNSNESRYYKDQTRRGFDEACGLKAWRVEYRGGILKAVESVDCPAAYILFF